MLLINFAIILLFLSYPLSIYQRQRQVNNLHAQYTRITRGGTTFETFCVLFLSFLPMCVCVLRMVMNNTRVSVVLLIARGIFLDLASSPNECVAGFCGAQPLIMKAIHVCPTVQYVHTHAWFNAAKVRCTTRVCWAG